MLIALLNGRRRNVDERLKHALREGVSVATTSVVAFELWFGVARSQRLQANTDALRRLFDGRIDILDFTLQDAEIAGRLRALIYSRGTPIGPYDIMIAAQALRLGRTLVTANTREFVRVPDLALADWTIAP